MRKHTQPGAFNPTLNCLPDGVPHGDLLPEPFKILHTPGVIIMLYEVETTFRQIFMDGRKLPADPSRTWQGYSVAEWGGDRPRDRRDGQGGPVQDKEGRLVIAEAQQKPADYLQVVTTRMRPGYLQKNGVPYSASAVIEEYFDTFSDPYTKNTWLVVTTMVTDPQYLIEPLVMHAHFKKLPDASGWDPTPCRTNEPR